MYSVCHVSCVLPAPGDLLRREGPGLLAVRFGVAERLWDDFSTLHSGETTRSGSPSYALTFLYQQTCSFFSVTVNVAQLCWTSCCSRNMVIGMLFMWHDFMNADHIWLWGQRGSKEPRQIVISQNRLKSTEQINNLMVRFQKSLTAIIIDLVKILDRDSHQVLVHISDVLYCQSKAITTIWVFPGM